MSAKRSAVAIFHTHELAENALRELEKMGFDMRKLSIVGKGLHSEESVIGYYNTGDRMLSWGQLGAFWGAMWGMLFGSAFFLLPGLGSVLVAGPLVAQIVAALEGAALVGGMSALGAALVSVGIPENSIVHYEFLLKMDKYLVIVHGTPDDIERAKERLQHSRLIIHSDPVAMVA